MRSRRIIRALEQIAQDQHQIASALARIADRVDPPLLEATKADLAQTESSFATDAAQAKIQDYIDAIWVATKRIPTDDEIVAHLEGREP